MSAHHVIIEWPCLVLTALLNKINGDLPKTPYFKFVDLWFLWHITTNFAIIIHHTILDKISYLSCPQEKQNKDKKVNIKVLPMNERNTALKNNNFWLKQLKEKKSSSAEGGHFLMGIDVNSLNRCAIIMLPIVNIIFYCTYAFLTL